MLPKAGKTLLLLGRPNVGKSLLFNRLTRTRDALVADEEGVTRDWQSGTLAPASAGRNPTDSVEHEEKSERPCGLAPQILDCGGVPDVIGYRVKAGVIEPSAQAAAIDSSAEAEATELSTQVDATESSAEAEAAEPDTQVDTAESSAETEADKISTKADFIKNSGKADIAEPSAKAYPEKDTETVEDLAGRVGGMVLQMTVDADLVMFLTDGSGTLTALDMEIAKFLRQNRSGPVWHVINKTDEQNPAVYLAEHSTIGLGQPVEVSARTGHGLSALRDKLWQDFSEPQDEAASEDDDPEAEEDEGRVLLLGRPNAGKSTLFNRLLGEERAVVSDLPGTTRDVVEMAVSLGNTSTKVRLLDSAGVARRFRRTTGASRLASNKSVRTLPKAQLAVVILDASAGVVEQDVRLIGEAVRCARGTLIVLNKADLLDSKEKAAISSELSRRVSFGEHLPRLFLSALKAHGIGALIKSIEQGIQEVTDELGTAWLNRLLQEAIQKHPPPSMGRYRAKLRYAHAVSLNPPRIVIYGSRCDNLPEHYRRYMEGAFRKALGMRVTRVQVEWSTTPNPYAENASKSSGRSSRRSAPNRSSERRSANRSADRPSGRPFYNKEKSEGGDRPAANRSYGHPSGDRPANGAERAERLGKGRSAANSSFGRSSAGRSSGGRPFGDRSFGDHPSGGRSSGGRPSGRSFSDKEGADRGRPSGSRPSGRPFYNKERSEQGGRPATNHFSGRASDRSSDRPANRSSDRPAYGAERLEKGRPSANRSFGRSSAGRSSGGRPFGDRSFGDHPSGSRSSGGRSSGRSFSDKEGAERGRSSANHSSGSRPSGRPFYNKDRSEQGGRPAANHFSGRASDRSSGRPANRSSDRPANGAERLEKGRPSANRSFGRPSGGRSSGGRPFGDRSFGDHPSGSRSSGGRSSGRSFSDKEGAERGRSSANHSSGSRPSGRPFYNKDRSEQGGRPSGRSFSDKGGADRDRPSGRPSGGRSSGRPFYSKERSERGGRPANHSSSRSSDRPAYGTGRAEKGRSSSSGRSATRGRRG